jgi:potassium channel subfamily K
MARRLRFSIAQPITISGFLVAGVLLVCDMAALTSSPDYYITEPKAEAGKNHALSGAFYYAIFAAVYYFCLAFLMCITVYGANRGYYKKDFQLTSSQRTLMLQTMSFMAYLLLGALVFSKIEGWEYLNAVYWANVTLLTVSEDDTR